MTSEQVNIAIAEWMGWSRAVADFYHDLNCVHDAALRLSDVPYMNKDGFNWTERCDFMTHLEGIALRDSKVTECNFEFYNATAPQRCEALLRTLNLWKE